MKSGPRIIQQKSTTPKNGVFNRRNRYEKKSTKFDSFDIAFFYFYVSRLLRRLPELPAATI